MAEPRFHQLAAKAVALGVQSILLDELVHDAKAREASELNNLGLAAQLEYLCSGETSAEVLKHLHNVANGGDW